MRAPVMRNRRVWLISLTENILCKIGVTDVAGLRAKAGKSKVHGNLIEKIKSCFHEALPECEVFPLETNVKRRLCR